MAQSIQLPHNPLRARLQNVVLQVCNPVYIRYLRCRRGRKLESRYKRNMTIVHA